MIISKKLNDINEQIREASRELSSIQSKKNETEYIINMLLKEKKSIEGQISDKTSEYKDLLLQTAITKDSHTDIKNNLNKDISKLTKKKDELNVEIFANISINEKLEEERDYLEERAEDLSMKVDALIVQLKEQAQQIKDIQKENKKIDIKKTKLKEKEKDLKARETHVKEQRVKVLKMCPANIKRHWDEISPILDKHNDHFITKDMVSDYLPTKLEDGKNI